MCAEYHKACPLMDDGYHSLPFGIGLGLWLVVLLCFMTCGLACVVFFSFHHCSALNSLIFRGFCVIRSEVYIFFIVVVQCVDLPQSSASPQAVLSATCTSFLTSSAVRMAKPLLHCCWDQVRNDVIALFR